MCAQRGAAEIAGQIDAGERDETTRVGAAFRPPSGLKPAATRVRPVCRSVAAEASFLLTADDRRRADRAACDWRRRVRDRRAASDELAALAAVRNRPLRPRAREAAPAAAAISLRQCLRRLSD